MNKNFARLLIGSGENSPEIRYLTGISTPDDFICFEYSGTVTALMSKLEISRAREAAKPQVAVLPESDYGTTRVEIISKIAETLKLDGFEVPPQFPLGTAEPGAAGQDCGPYHQCRHPGHCQCHRSRRDFGWLFGNC